MRLAFVQPSFGRLALSALCLEQRRHCCDELAGYGIDATCVVVADDENLDTARSFGFEPLDRPNKHVGWRVNEGIEYACREWGADYVVTIGSDDWALASYIAEIPDARSVHSGRYLALVSPAGDRLARFRSPDGTRGYIPWVIPRALVEPCGFRPAKNSADRGVDGSVKAGIERAADWGPFKAAEHDWLQAVDFKTAGPQITPYEYTVASPTLAWEEGDPFAVLATRYPADLCERMQALYHH